MNTTDKERAPRVTVTSRMEEGFVERLGRLSEADKRTLSQLVEMCVEGYLPKLEERVLGKQFVGGVPKKLEVVK